MLRELTGPHWLPSQVFVPHAKPTRSVHYRNLFRVQPSFDSEFCSLRFPAYWLDRPVDDTRDHVLGAANAAITLVEYGSYDCPHCRLANERIAEVRDQFGDRVRYVFRHQIGHHEIRTVSNFQRGDILYTYEVRSDSDFYQNIVELGFLLHF